MSANPASTSTSATLRPRNRRLVSIEGDEHPRSRSLSPVASLPEDRAAVISSRDASPLPAPHPSRATSTPRSNPKTTGRKGFQAPSSLGPKNTNALFTPGYWETSWSSIQGIASTLLGNEVKDATHSSTARRKPPLSNSAKFNVRSTSDDWGPPGSAERHIAQGSQEDRLSKLQAKKRESLLLANGHTEPDRMGQYKRRMSTEEAALSPQDNLLETPVYLHHVQKSDTLAGLSIRFNCPQSAICRANRLYPNDTIQVRDRVYLPVDSCAVRGRKVASPTTVKPIADPPTPKVEAEESTKTPTGPPAADWTIASPPPISGQANATPQTAASPSISINTSGTSQSATDPSYVHDSWVMIDHIPDPVEIVRMSRRALGFFPPARRRSQSYTDATPVESPVSELPSITASMTSSPNRSSTPQDPPVTRGRRSVSSPQRVNREHGPESAASYFLNTLSGPGGVGSLSRNASPGPAMDKLNSFWNNQLTPAAARAAAQAAAQLNLRIPNNNLHMQAMAGERYASSSPRRQAGLGGGLGSLSAARTSVDSVASVGSELAGRVEGWVRRTGGTGTRSPAAGSDLIELQESTESLDGNGKQRRGSVSGREIEEERMLRERFPARGRVFEEQTRGRDRVK